jgi:hypothetical protein
MRKTTLFTVVAATLIVIGFGLWAASPAKTPVSSIGQGIEPHQLMVNAKNLSRAEFVDYTFVFH